MKTVTINYFCHTTGYLIQLQSGNRTPNAILENLLTRERNF